MVYSILSILLFRGLEPILFDCRVAALTTATLACSFLAIKLGLSICVLLAVGRKGRLRTTT